jgi:hypothetical protein
MSFQIKPIPTPVMMVMMGFAAVMLVVGVLGLVGVIGLPKPVSIVLIVVALMDVPLVFGLWKMSNSQ